MEWIEVCGIPIRVEKKHIKNLHLYVKPPDGDVSISAPLDIKMDNIHVFAVSKITWIKKQRKKFQLQERQTEREYISGESIYVWGRRYNLEVICSNRHNDIQLRGSNFYLYVREASTAKQREKYVNEWYRSLLKEAMYPVVRKYEDLIGVSANEWCIKNMTTKWGTCNIDKKRIWINLQLAKKTPESLEYVVVHELCHFFEKNHNDTFRGHLDRYYPQWREVKNNLNAQILDYRNDKG